MIPYDAPFIAKLLRRMTPAQLQAATATKFQTAPAQVAIKAATIRELIANEKQRRA